VQQVPTSKRRSRKKVALIATPILLIALAAALIAPTLMKARSAYQKIFVTSVPRVVVTQNAEGTPVIVPGATQSAQLPDWDKKERVNILLLGADTNASRKAEGEVPLSDTIIIMSIDPATKKVGMLSIPRDLLVEIPGVGQDKINAAYSNGELSSVTGPGLVRATIEYNFGIKIDYYAVVDFAGFQKIVDTLGGVTLDVSAPIKDDQYPGEDFNYTRVIFHTGLQHMSGQQALRYVRTRHDDNDFARGNRQQQLLTALRQQSLSLGLITQAPQLISQLGDTIRTDLPPSDALKLAKLGTEINSSNIQNYSLLDATTSQWDAGQPYYLIPDWDKVHAILNQMMPQTATPTSAATPSASVEQPNLRAQVLIENGTFVNKLAATSSAKLNDNGFLNVSVAQAAAAGNYPTSQVIDYSGNLATARLIAQALGLPASAVKTGDPSQANGQDVVVILGNDAPTTQGP
jgi:polyisoprenyl-teichoic acid--peptidoglycan teichoic acid transferase